MNNNNDTSTLRSDARYRQFIRDSAPAPELRLKEMFDFIACSLCPQSTLRSLSQAVRRWIDCAAEHENIQDGCGKRSGHTFRFTREFIRSHGLDEDQMISWLMSFDDDPCCDCQGLLDVGIFWLPPVYNDDGDECGWVLGWGDPDPESAPDEKPTVN